MPPFDSVVIPLPTAVPNASPPARIVSIDTYEFDEFSETPAGWSVQHHALRASCRSSAFLAATGSLQVGVVQHTTGYSSQGANPVGTITVAVPVDDGRPMVHRGHLIEPMQLGLMRSGEGFECLCRSGIRFVVASLKQEKVERYAAWMWHQSNLGSSRVDRLRFVDPEHRSRYLEACRRFLDTAFERPGVLTDPQSAALLEEDILESLFQNVHVSASDPCDSSRYSVARRAHDYLRDCGGDVPSVRALCAATGASYSTLERGFRETYGMSPKAMMTAMRLSGARRAFLHAGETTTVTDVALRWGFVEFGRFSALYRRRYSETPSETLRKVRGVPPARQPDRPLLPLTKSA